VHCLEDDKKTCCQICANLEIPVLSWPDCGVSSVGQRIFTHT